MRLTMVLKQILKFSNNLLFCETYIHFVPLTSQLTFTYSKAALEKSEKLCSKLTTKIRERRY